MSSHHIIREDQEPALVIDNAESAHYDSIQQLLEWSPTVIVTTQALEQVLLWGIKIDVVIAVGANIENLKISLREQYPVKILPCNQQHEAIETALHFLTTAKQKAVNIISDTALSTVEKFSTVDISVLQSGKRWVLIRNGHFEKWFPAGRTICIYHNNKFSATTTDLDGTFRVDKQGIFWIAEE